MVAINTSKRVAMNLTGCPLREIALLMLAAQLKKRLADRELALRNVAQKHYSLNPNSWWFACEFLRKHRLVPEGKLVTESMVIAYWSQIGKGPDGFRNQFHDDVDAIVHSLCYESHNSYDPEEMMVIEAIIDFASRQQSNVSRCA